jgi:3-methyladenine DNA glycosylase AlkD
MSILKNTSHSSHDEKLTGPFHEAKAKLEQIEAEAKRKGIAIAAITGLAVTKGHIDRKLEDLKKAHESNQPRARAEIATDVAAFVAAVDELGKKAKETSAKK